MTMRHKKSLFQTVLITTWMSISYGCQMEGVTTWFTPVTTTVLDTHSGSFFNRATTNIVGINSITYGEGLNSGPYVQVTHSNSVFDITTNVDYQSYEENETVQSMTFTVVFGCTSGSTGTLVFIINVIDTNNNPPQFLPNNQFEFTITPPLPPGYQITGCLQDITVRDIDLTTQRIDFSVEPNEYFEIDYDATLSIDPKEFKAVLRTTTFIRALSEPVELIISATDVDLTGDPPITTSATIRITPDTEFQFPEEPVFAQAFYLAKYADNQVTLDDPITLQQGFHELVQFTLEGEHSMYFDLQIDGNKLSLAVIEPLSPELLRQGQLILAVRAEREFTSGATATVVLQLPEVLGLRFENTLYEGRIVDDEMEPLQLVVAQGYEGGFSVDVTGVSSAFFTTADQGNIITLSFSAPPNPIEESFISIQVSASNDFSTASAVVTLEVIRDDVTTPAFQKAIYTGDYKPETGLTLEPIALVQGYDETVSFSLEGEHASYFEVTQNGPEVSIIALPLPAQVLSKRNLILSLQAAKPRTVGANAAIYIELPPAREVAFESLTYSGSIEEDNLVLAPIIMSVGYGDDISFSLSGDYATYFTVSNVQNQISLIQSTPLPQDVVSSEDFLILTLSASGELTLTASTVLILKIVKQDTNTPVFGQSVYVGSYSEFSLEIENIGLVQGYDSSVTFRLDGDYANYFDISSSENNNIVITMTSNIPEELIFDQKVLLFNIIADKPLTVGANAVIAIRFPPDLTELTALKFAQNTYIGSIENNILALDSITLEKGYNVGTEFALTGAYASHFTISFSENIVTISVHEPLPVEVIQTNRYIVLELEAERDQAVSAVTSIIIDLISPEVEQPLFGQPYYRGIYTEDSGLQLEQAIILTQGFDETVTFSLDGDSSQWFILSMSGDSVTLEVNEIIPSQVIESNHQLLFTIVASKFGTPPGLTVISIELPKEMDPVILHFEQNSYVGRIENGELQAPAMTLLGENIQQLQLTVSGEYASYFILSQESNNVLLQLSGVLSSEVDESFIVINIEASTPNAISGYTTVVIEIVKDPVITRPIFEQAYYVGEYSEKDGLIFDNDIQLIEGHDESVSFTLEGDDAQWFEIIYDQNESLSLILNDITFPVDDRSQLIFSIVANKLNSLVGRAAIVIINSDYPQKALLQFSQIFYKGTIESGTLTVEAISLDGYSADTVISVAGDYVNYFQLLNEDGTLSLELLSPLPNDITDGNSVLILTLVAQAPTTSTGATIVIELPKDQISAMSFEEIYYLGSYSESDNLIIDSQISLTSGYDESVSFYLDGEQSQWFSLQASNNLVSLTLDGPIPPAVLINNQQLIFIIIAQKNGIAPAKATIVISLTNDISETEVLGFNKISYRGSIENDQVNLEQVILTEGYNEDVSFWLDGELANLFTLNSDREIVTISLQSPIPEESMPANQIILLEIQATAPQSISAYATIVFEVIQNEIIVEDLIFSEVYYTGKYTEEEGLIFDVISLSQGYDKDVTFDLEGDQSQWFGLQASENVITLTLISPIPPAVLLNNEQLIYIIIAEKPGSSTARATVVISLSSELTEVTILGFNKISYLGTIDNNQVNLEAVVLNEGHNENVAFTLHGEFADFFTISSEEETVTITLKYSILEESIPINRVVVLEIQASAPQYVSAYATIVFEVLDNDAFSEELSFTELYYMGQYIEGSLIFESSISLSEDFDETIEFLLEGENTQWFNIVVSGNAVTLTVSNIPQEILENNQNLIFTIVAEKPGSLTARAVIIVSIVSTDGETTPGVSFERALYKGVVRDGSLQHEAIALSGYDGIEVTLFGTYAELFRASVSDGSVTVQMMSSVTLAPDVVYVALEMKVFAASAVLLLDIEHEEPSLPTVTFGATTYSIRIDVSQTGFLERVEAAASNGEAVSYSLVTQDDHLSQRISISQEGELHLSAPADMGVYSFEVVATTVYSSVSGKAVVQLTVAVIAECGDDKIVPPLIILDRNEEEPHRNLVVISEEHAGCRYSLTNRWPEDQTWLYVDDTGLHANAIDREDASIAFMALSQIQVELLLECDSDIINSIARKNKRSVNQVNTSLNHLGPYDYGDTSWILTDSILHNSRRTLVNLIVNDINDNYPIFVGKDEEPITVGYPIPELEERVSPRALIELQATDADIGENAALLYWSLDEVLAVSPLSGLVHVRQNSRLEDGDSLSVFATDQIGQGLTGNVTLLVKLLDVTNIAVVTISNAFLEDEQAILENLSTTVGYEVKALRATVISDGLINNENASRRKRDVTTFGASLQIYVYGLMEREPVPVDRLTADLTNDWITTVTITRTVSLEDHLEEMRDSSGRDTGLLIATIVLSVLLFILIALAAVWFFLKWRKERNYDKFNDESSTASLDESGELPKQIEVMPRLNIEELKKSERRLQERLEAPDVTVESNSSKQEPSLPLNTESVVVPMPDTSGAIVIQDKLKDAGDESDDEDEFGEKKTSRRKSVVTFNENVEKIIHVESSSTSDDDSSIHEVWNPKNGRKQPIK